ncbi:MAG TPA: MOSC N-terminal beta barrel domain-containing protein [Longimicrobiales bacterium]|nr:MOSC N-terminal beta barrel domain-containing protein [Longimicrobiales bacterium]
MRVSELTVYPVKGCAGVALEQAELDSFGVRHDRRWMIARPDGDFVTQRGTPQLALLETALEANALVLRSRTAGEARVPLAGPEGAAPVRLVRIWDDVVEALDAGDEAADLVGRHLGAEGDGLRLVYMPDSTLRQVSPAHARPGDRVSFADGFPLLVVTQQSLDELNRRLPEPVPMHRFRPNVVVDDAPSPHDEDTWRRIRLGSVPCDVVKPCARCVVTTVDQATAVAGVEPLRTLAAYRRQDGLVWFAQNAIHRATGWLAVGDDVEVLERGEPRPAL